MTDKDLPPLEMTRDYSVREARRYLNVHYEVVLRYIRDGVLSAKKIRTKGLREEWRIRGRDIKVFQNKRVQTK